MPACPTQSATATSSAGPAHWAHHGRVERQEERLDKNLTIPDGRDGRRAVLKDLRRVRQALRPPMQPGKGMGRPALAELTGPQIVIAASRPARAYCLKMICVLLFVAAAMVLPWCPASSAAPPAEDHNEPG